MEANSHPSAYDRDATRSLGLLDLPHETLTMITELLSRHDKAKLASTNNAMNSFLEPQLWRKIKTCIGTPKDTAGLVNLLTARPDIIPLIKVIVLDEYHPCHTRRLLSIEMPEMWGILIQHEGRPVEQVGEREKRSLNRSMLKQPKLSDFVFWIEFQDHTRTPYCLTKEDSALFRQPNVTRFRLSYVDFSSFRIIDKTFLTHGSLEKFFVEESNYTVEAFECFLSPSKNLMDLNITQHTGGLPFIPTYYLPTITSYAATLRVLQLKSSKQLDWRSSPGFSGLDLTAFSALRLLRIHPSLLLGPGAEDAQSYTAGTSLNITDLIRSRFPSGLRMLLLESLTTHSFLKYLQVEIYPQDEEFIRCLIEQRQSLAPRLKFINLYYLEDMVEPTELYDLAIKHSIEISAWYAKESIDPDFKILDADTFVARNGEVRSW
ncbi:MAG: hypothetical protein Q9215_003497 [Flavoplaca cf. flavocitrina]